LVSKLTKLAFQGTSNRFTLTQNLLSMTYNIATYCCCRQWLFRNCL